MTDPTTAPLHSVLAVVLQVRADRLSVLLWQRAREPFAGAWVLPGGLLAPERDARGVDPPAPGGEGRRAGARPPRAARHVERSGPEPGWEIATAFLGLVPADVDPQLPADTAWHPVDQLPSLASTTARSCSRGGSGCAGSSRTRTPASRSHREAFTLSELRGLYAAALGHDVSATNLKRVLLRRGVLESTGARREPGRAGGRPAELLLASARATSRSPIRSRRCGRRLADRPTRSGSGGARSRRPGCACRRRACHRLPDVRAHGLGRDVERLADLLVREPLASRRRMSHSRWVSCGQLGRRSSSRARGRAPGRRTCRPAATADRTHDLGERRLLEHEALAPRSIARRSARSPNPV